VAINPPSDIVLDVLKAADPARLAQAQQRLSALRAGRIGAAEDFAGWVEAARTDSQAADARSRLAPAGAVPDKTARRQVEFEAMVLNSFVGEIIPKSNDRVFGTGFAGEMWRSVLADQIAHQIAKSGSLGIAKRLFASHELKARTGQTFGHVQANNAAPGATQTHDVASVSGASADGIAPRGGRRT
jgi:hypothetical protein